MRLISGSKSTDVCNAKNVITFLNNVSIKAINYINNTWNSVRQKSSYLLCILQTKSDDTYTARITIFVITIKILTESSVR